MKPETVKSVTVEAGPYEDGSGHKFKVKTELDQGRGLMIGINDMSIWFSADDWPLLRDAVETTLKPFGR